ncbi:MAG: PQQ-dependent sugar dehydrogenase, partial [Gammaproteobacteria bacterium]|nr:PQQ-dependent sugar dehydrogenase [Gammaproteobacteria bacterium]
MISHSAELKARVTITTPPKSFVTGESTAKIYLLPQQRLPLTLWILPAMQHRSSSFQVATVVLAILAPPVSAQVQEAPLKTECYTLKVETLASGLSSPWSVALLPDGLILITEKPGNLRVMRDGKLLAAPVSGLPKVTVRGQGGLLDVVAHPGYRQNRLIYWSFAAGNDSEVGTEVARSRLDCQRDLCSVSDVQVIFVQKPK